MARRIQRKRPRKRAPTTAQDEEGVAPRSKRVKLGDDTGVYNIRASQDHHHLQHPVLTLYFPLVGTLRDALASRLPATSKKRRRILASVGKEKGRRASTQDGSESNELSELNRERERLLAQLLDETLVGDLQQTPADAHRQWAELANLSQELTLDGSSIGSGHCSQAEIVDIAIWMLFNQPSRALSRGRHLLCHGYRRSFAPTHGDQGHPAVLGIPGLVSRYPNSSVSALKGSLWAEVLHLLGKEGERVMLELLLDVCIFSKSQTGDENYYQLSGVPLSDLKPRETPKLRPGVQSSPTDVTRKSAQCRPSTRNNQTLHTPGTIHLVRTRMLYARAALNAKGNVRFGLRHIHVLNRFADHANLEHNVHVMKYIFPRQFGLHNVFTSKVDTRETVQPFMDYTLREREITLRTPTKAAALKVPKRLRGVVLRMVAKLQKLHKRCSYVELLLHHCPFGVGSDGWSSQGKSSNPPAAPEADGSRRSRGALALPLVKRRRQTFASVREDTSKYSFLDFATPVSSVSAFCRAAIANVIPNEFWGGAYNRRVLMRRLDEFVHLRRFENFSLHEVLQECKITNISWLAPPHCNSQTHLSSTDFEKRSEIFAEFVYYLFDSFLIPLIRSNFHVTESSAHQNRLFFFRHDVWRSLSEPAISSLKTSMYEELHTEKVVKALENRPLGFSQIRLLPKEVGARPIVNLRRRVRQRQNGKIVLGRSINSIMAPVHNMLNYEKITQPAQLGSSMFSVGDMYMRLKAYKGRLQQLKRPSQPLYFAKVDVRSCFDTIPQSAVIALVESLITQDEYRIERHVEFKPAPPTNASHAGKPRRRFIANAAATDDFFTFGEHVEDRLAQGKKNMIFVNHTMPTKERSDTLLKLLRAHITQNLVKIGKKFYRQREGIPQGSVVSSLLCNFFYADLERTRLGFLDVNDAGEDVLFRLLDDFMLITPSRERAVQFLETVHRGVPAYGVSAQLAKSLVNFEVAIDGQTVPKLEVNRTSFPYCGTLIDTHTLELCKDRKQKPGSRLSDSLSVELSKTPGRTFQRKTLNSFGIQAQRMFLDTDLNSASTVLANLYSNFFNCAMKVHQYLKCLPAKKRPRSSFLIGTMQDLMEMAYTLIKSQERRHPRDETVRSMGHYQCAVTKTQVRWLAATAFQTALTRKQTQYQELLAWLKAELGSVSLPSPNEVLRLKRAVKDGGKAFEGWRY